MPRMHPAVPQTGRPRAPHCEVLPRPADAGGECRSARPSRHICWVMERGCWIQTCKQQSHFIICHANSHPFVAWKNCTRAQP
jgi:hypothetical protein